MTNQQFDFHIQEAKTLIPRSGLGKDMHLVLDDILQQRSCDVVGDIEGVAGACKPLPWEWAKSAVEALNKALELVRVD